MKRESFCLLVILFAVFSGTMILICTHPLNRRNEMPPPEAVKKLQQWKEHAVRLFDCKNYSTSERVLMRILKEEPENFAMRRLLGCIYFKTGRQSQAQQLFVEMLQKRPQDAVARNNLGMILAKEHKYEAALRSLLEAEKLLPASGLIHANLAYLYRQINSPIEAQEHWNKSIELLSTINSTPPPDVLFMLLPSLEAEVIYE